MLTLVESPRDTVPWFRLTRTQAAARGVRLVEWLCMQETHIDVRHSVSPQSGGVVAGCLTVRRALGWVWAPTLSTALREAPEGTVHVIARANLLSEDKEGWLKRPLGDPVLEVTPYFSEGTKYWHTLLARAEREAEHFGVPFVVRRIANAA